MLKLARQLRERNLKIVLTGGPGVGKTSIVHNLAALGFDVRREVFTEIFEAAAKKGTLENLLKHPGPLLHGLVQRQLEIENSVPTAGTTFYDRGMVDILGFARNLKLKFTASDRELIDGAHYDAALIVEPLTESNYVKNDIRRQTFTESLEHHSKIIETYRDYCTQKMKGAEFLILVPKESIELRTKWIMEHLVNYKS